MLEKQPTPGRCLLQEGLLQEGSLQEGSLELQEGSLEPEGEASLREPTSPARLAQSPWGGGVPPEREGGARLGSGPEARRHSILIVDDDDAIREALEDVLSDEGYHVVGMSDGQQALTYLQAEPRPSAMLVDLWMPVMDGWKFLDAVLDDPRFSRIPLIVLTAARDQRARELRVSEVLTKPVQLQQVLAALERLTKVPRVRD
jgi:CheY-like chemotaxis protein